MISTELNRIINAKAAIKEIIEHSGGSAPDGALLSDYADAIMALRSNGEYIENSQSYLTFECVGLMTNRRTAWISWGNTGGLRLNPEYKINGQESWTRLEKDVKVYLRLGDKIAFKSSNRYTGEDENHFNYFYGGDGYFRGCGNLLSLTDFTTPTTTYAFARLFSKVSDNVLPLLEAPDFSKIWNINGYMFYRTFYENTYLLNGPEIDATHILSLITPTGSCNEMCRGCTNLRYIKILTESTINSSSAFWTNVCADTNSNGRFFRKSGAPSLPSGWQVLDSTLFG